jgi:hypothetical protein
MRESPNGQAALYRMMRPLGEWDHQCLSNAGFE